MENTYKSDYVVFIDESFNEWFSLKKEDADFCHAGIAIPTSRLHDTDNFVSALKKSILHYSRETKNDTDEIKYASIRGLSEEKKQEVAKKIDYFCMKNSCYIFGFYSSLTPWLNNLLRDKYFYKYGGNIKDYAEDIDIERNELKNEILTKNSKNREEKYDVKILRDTYEKLIQFMINFFIDINKTFTIQYDPRQKKEDKILNEIALGFADDVCEKLLNKDNPCLGFDNSLKSEESAGLTLADFITGDIRGVFRAHNEILESGSEFKILSAIANENMCIRKSDGTLIPFYRKVMPASIWTEIISDKNFIFHGFYKYLAGNKISCYAKYGEARHIDFKEKSFYDMAD